MQSFSKGNFDNDSNVQVFMEPFYLYARHTCVIYQCHVMLYHQQEARGL